MATNIPKVTAYAGRIPALTQQQPEFNQNTASKLNYDAQVYGSEGVGGQLNATIEAMNAAGLEIENNAASAASSANIAQSVIEGAGYKGLWPDSGGSALKGETWQTQAGGVPTGSYFTALQNTSVDPVNDDVNWKLAVSARYVASALEKSLGVNARIWPKSGNIKVGDVVPSAQQSSDGLPITHLIVDGNAYAMSPLASGLVSDLTDTGATIGGLSVELYAPQSGGLLDLSDFINFDGSDETHGFARAVKIANTLGLKIISSKTGTVRLTPSSTGIDLQCDVDIRNVTIKPEFIDSSKSYLFRSTQAIQDITSEVDLTKLTKGAHRLYSVAANQPINRVGFAIIESTAIARFRYDNGVWSPVLAKQPLTIGSWFGDLSQKIYFNFAALAGVTVKYKPQTRKLNIQLGDIDLTGSEFYSLFRCERNDVEFGYGELKGFSNANNNALYTPCENFQCNNFTISRSTAYQIGSEANTGYFCLLNQSDNTRVKDVQNAAGWGGIDGNYFARLTVENSTVYAVSGHAYASDIVVVDSYIYRYGNIQGYGKYIMDNVKLVSRGYPESMQNDYFVRVRKDYGSSWDGEIKLINPSVDAKNALSKFEFVFVEGAETDDAYRGFDYNYIPDVLVQNPRFRSDENTSTVTSVWVISMESGESTKDWVRYTYLPRTLTVNDGDIKAANGVRIKSVRNRIGRYDGMVFLTRSRYLNINVSDISADVPLEYASRWSEVDSIYGIEIFPLIKSQKVRQKVIARNADWHGVYLRTTQNVDITINDSNVVGPYRGSSADAGNVYTLDSDSKFKINGGRVIKMWDLGSNFASQVIRTYMRGVTFDWASYFTGVNASTLDPMYHATFQAQVALIWGCEYAAPRFSNDSVSGVLTDHANEGYSNSSGLSAIQMPIPAP
jgi:hypothetical protein